MTKYADTVPNQDKERILDMFYGRGNYSGTKIIEDTERMKRIMKNKYTEAQIKAVIFDDVDKGCEL